MKRCHAFSILLLCLLLAFHGAAAEVEGRITIDQSGTVSGLSAVKIRIFRGGALLSSATTDEDGRFSMPLRIAQNCRLYVKLPERAFFEEDGPVNPVQPDAWEGWSEPFDLTEGQILRFPDIRTVSAASVSGRAWEDRNADGLLQEGEAPLPGTYVVLLNMEGEPTAVDSVRVYAGGTFSFPRLHAGRYALAFHLPDGYLFTKVSSDPGGSCAAAPKDVRTAVSSPFTLETSESRGEMNIGGFLPAQIGDSVWIDANGNGLQDYREPGYAGARLTLTDAAGTPLEDTASDEYGYYHFPNLTPGDYRIRLSVPEAHRLTGLQSAALGEIDSDADPDTAATALISLTTGEVRRNVDFGLVPLPKTP